MQKTMRRLHENNPRNFAAVFRGQSPFVWHTQMETDASALVLRLFESFKKFIPPALIVATFALVRVTIASAAESCGISVVAAAAAATRAMTTTTVSGIGDDSGGGEDDDGGKPEAETAKAAALKLIDVLFPRAWR